MHPEQIVGAILHTQIDGVAALYGSGWRCGDRRDLGSPAWKRPLGLPLENPGKTRTPGDIDDGYWQGVPVGGLGAGTFSRSYRGDFARWHIKAAVHKYEPVYANQFAMFQQSEGDAKGVAQVLMNGQPQGAELSAWQWNYPGGRGQLLCAFPQGLV